VSRGFTFAPQQLMKDLGGLREPALSCRRLRVQYEIVECARERIEIPRDVQP
jgi:hypothetical protein